MHLYRELRLYILSTLIVGITAITCFATPIAYAATPITSCTVITIPGAYTIQNDITATSSQCILVGADNVSIDGQGHTVTGTVGGGDEGIHVEDYVHVTVSNIRLTNFERGISVTNTSNILIQNVSAYLSATNIFMDTVASSTITASTISSSTASTGLLARDVTGLRIASSTFAGNNPRAIAILSPNSSSNITIFGNTFSDFDGNDAVTFYANQSSIAVQNNTFMSTAGGSGVNFDTGTFNNSLVTNNTFTGNYAGIGAYTTAGSNNVYSYNTFNQVDNALYFTGSNASFVHNTVLGATQNAVAADSGSNLLVSDNTLNVNNLGGYGVSLTNMSSTTVWNNQILNVSTGIYGNTISSTRLLNNTFSTSTGDMISINGVTGGLTVSGNIVANPAGVAFIVSTADGRVSGNTLRITDNDFTSNVYPFALQTVHTATVLHNSLRGPVWVYDDTGDNSYNDATTGNTYYNATGTPAYTLFNILDTDGNGYADVGTALPFSSTTVGTVLWPMLGHDAHPATPNAPSLTVQAKSSSGNRSGRKVHYGCKDPKATNYENLARSRPELCTYTTPEPTIVPSAGVCTPYLTDSIQFGVQNDPAQVQKLETFLNDKQGEHLTVDGMYTAEDVAAVKRFQQKYASEILGVWGLSQPTGYVYRTTILKINSFHCASSIQCPYFAEYNSSTQNPETTEVGKTKELLKELGFYSGEVNDTFDAGLQSSLKTFQETFSATMLKPWGLSSGTGYKYKTTNKFLNMIVGCKTPSVELDGKGTFDYQ